MHTRFDESEFIDNVSISFEFYIFVDFQNGNFIFNFGKRKRRGIEKAELKIICEVEEWNFDFSRSYQPCKFSFLQKKMSKTTKKSSRISILYFVINSAGWFCKKKCIFSKTEGSVVFTSFLQPPRPITFQFNPLLPPPPEWSSKCI